MAKFPNIMPLKTPPQPAQTFFAQEDDIYIPDGVPPLYEHQKATVRFGRTLPRFYDMSDPGTAKTRAQLTLWAERRFEGGGTLLVFCLKSLIESVWLDQINLWFPNKFLTSMAFAKNREQAFAPGYDIYITNIDAVKWVSRKTPAWLRKRSIDTIIIDEAETLKHASSDRSRAADKLVRHVPYLVLMGATPENTSVTDLWHQYYLLDQGKRLGESFIRFRSLCCDKIDTGSRFKRWEDKAGIDLKVAGMTKDITIRHPFEACTDIPAHDIHILPFSISDELRASYEQLAESARLELKEGSVTAVHEASLKQKLLQVLSGSVYGDDGVIKVDTARYELIMDLVKERPWPSLVFFLWRHQREALVKHAQQEGFDYGYIDGTVPDRKRAEEVTALQKGDRKVLFLQPQSAAHGLTLTKARTNILASPIAEPAKFKQLMHRVYRTGQNHKTETLIPYARNTIEVQIGVNLKRRRKKLESLLSMLEY